MDDNIINQEVNSTSVVNEENLFDLVENNLNDSEKIDAPAYSYWRSVIKSFFRNPGNIICISLFLIVVLLAYIQPAISGYTRFENIEATADQFIKPFVTKDGVFYIFGTDKFSDDLWDFSWKGTQFSLNIAFLATIIDMTLGIIVGALWGYSKFFDKIFTELYNIIANVPSLVVTIIILYSLGTTFWNMIIAMTCTAWLGIGYSFRTQVIIIRDRDYNLASRCLGTGTFRMITHNILPFLVSIIVTYVSNYLPSFIGYEVFLSFIGIGFTKEIPSLGSAIDVGKEFMLLPDKAHVFWIPVAISAIVTITLYVAGQGLADASDPRNHR